MSLKARFYSYLMSRTAPELMLFILASFVLGSVLTLVFNVVGYIAILGAVLYGLYWFANYQKKQDLPEARK